MIWLFTAHSRSSRLRAVKEICTPAELDAVTVRSSTIVVIDYQKSKCKPCMKIEPLFNALSEKYSAQVLKWNSLFIVSFKMSNRHLKKNPICSGRVLQSWCRHILYCVGDDEA